MLQLKTKPLDLAAFKRFEEIGLPSKNNEAYTYVRLKELYSLPFSLPSYGNIKKDVEVGELIFINGIYTHTLSHIPKPFIALPLSEALVTYGSFLKSRIRKQLEQERDPFAALNGAYAGEGLFLYLPPKSVYEPVLKITHFVEEFEKPTLIAPRVHIFVGKGSSAHITFSQNISFSHLWVNGYFDLALEEAASVHVNILSDQHAAAHHFMALRATLKGGSHFKSYDVTNGGGTSRHDYVVSLEEAGAHAELYGVWNLKQHRQHHVNVFMDHKEPHCTSLQKFKGILWDTSHSSFEGKIFVHQRAQKTEAYQMNKNLLLSEGAAAYAKPNLEIFADDVKASHGATVGHLDREHLFYLMARGLSQETASRLLVGGFMEEIIAQLQEEIRNNARRIMA